MNQLILICFSESVQNIHRDFFFALSQKNVHKGLWRFTVIYDYRAKSYCLLPYTIILIHLNKFIKYLPSVRFMQTGVETCLDYF